MLPLHHPRVWLVVAALALALAVSAAPVPWEVRYPRAVSLEGTVWSGDGVVAPTVYMFEAGGVLRYSYRGRTHRNGTWAQDGDAIYWEANQKYCEFRGTVSGDEMRGNAWNKAGGKWTLKMTRQVGDTAPAPPPNTPPAVPLPAAR